jgi:hypothetical protein
MMDARRIALIDTDGRIVAEIDVTNVENCNIQAPFILEVQTRCDMGDWHTGETVTLAPWGHDLKNPARPSRARINPRGLCFT